MNSIGEPLTLYSLNALVRDALSNALPSHYWVTGELSEVRETTAGHCYIELVERDETGKTLMAKARGTIWSRVYTLLRPYFLEETGQPFAAGLKVMLRVSVNFHELYGYTLDVCDIEPAYTLGDMARLRQLVIKRLTDEGVIGLNKELEFPLLPQRVAVISSATAAGYGDFCDQLLGNRYGYCFYPHLFPAPMQGSKVEQGIIAALDKIASNAAFWDVVVIIRGGGATSELNCFDTYDLANNCAQFPLPIITGIGHQRDESVLDIVAHTSVKTPTAAAELLVHTMLARENELAGMMQGVTAAVRSRLECEHQRLVSLVRNLPLNAALFMKGEQVRLNLMARKLATSLQMFLKDEDHRLCLLEKGIDAASPEKVLAMGYSITRINGKAVRSVAELSPGDKVETVLSDGGFSSVVME